MTATFMPGSRTSAPVHAVPVVIAARSIEGAIFFPCQRRSAGSLIRTRALPGIASVRAVATRAP